MINEIIEAIRTTLSAEFGDHYEIHMEEIQQDLTRPYFFISCINPTSRLFLGNRDFRENMFCLQYFPEQKGHDKRECYDVAERLFQCLESVDVGGTLVKGTKRKCEFVNGILNFFVNYDVYVEKAVSLPTMEELEGNIKAKGR